MNKGVVQVRFPYLKPDEIDANTLIGAKKKMEADIERWCDETDQWPVTAAEFDCRYFEGRPVKGREEPFTGTVITGYCEVESRAAVRAMYEHYGLRPPLKGDSQRCQVQDCPTFAERTLILENASATAHDGRILKLYLCDTHARELDPPAA